jgi:hypothetical protein
MDAWGLKIYASSIGDTVRRLIPLLAVGLEQLFWRFFSLLFSLLLRWPLQFGTSPRWSSPSNFFSYTLLRFVLNIRGRKVALPEF